jgi:hypothetical protein
MPVILNFCLTVHRNLSNQHASFLLQTARLWCGKK